MCSTSAARAGSVAVGWVWTALPTSSSEVSAGLPSGDIAAQAGRVTDFPHFMIKDKLLYRVTKKNSDICEQLLIPKEYASKVLYLAHSHLLGAHLGREKRGLSRPKSTGTGSCSTTPTCRANLPRGVITSILEVGYFRVSPWMQDTDNSSPQGALANCGRTRETILPESKSASVSLPAIFTGNFGAGAPSWAQNGEQKNDL